jgi:hypothetical protein
MRRRGRPGLLGTVARTAVIAGTAQATANAVNRGAHHRDVAPAGFAPPAAPVSAPATGSDVGNALIDDLTRLAGLRDAGVLTEEEFTAAKGRLLRPPSA